MSEAKHTPGPWRTGRWPHGHCRIYAPSESHAIARTYDPEMNGIGVCALTGPRNEADARLIAAAPELLEALESLSASYARIKPPGYPPSDAEKLAFAAIAKATGAA